MSARRCIRTSALIMLSLAISPTLTVAEKPLGNEFQVNTYSPGGAYPAVASDEDGDFVVVWDGWDGDHFGVFGQVFDMAGNPVGGEFQVNSYTTGDQRHADVASDADGDFVVVWQSPGDGSSNGVFAQRFDPSGSPVGNEFQVNTYTTGEQGGAAIASGAGGDFAVIWSGEGRDDDSGVFGQLYDSSGSPKGTQFLVNSYTTGDQSVVGVASDAEGDFVVVFQSPGPGVQGQLFDSSGNAVGGEFQAGGEGYFTDAWAVASDAAGNFVVVWSSYFDNGVEGWRFDSQANRLAEFSVSGANYNKRVAVSSDSDGDFIVAWNRGAVIGQEMKKDGTKRGSEFQMNTTPAFRTFADVAMSSDGDFVAVWPGDSGNIMGQRYAGPLHVAVGHATCPGEIAVSISNAPPNSEVALVRAANQNGFTKGGTLCNGTQFQIGEPFQLPPVFVIVDGSGNGSTELVLGANRCHVQALALASCETSNVVLVP